MDSLSDRMLDHPAMPAEAHSIPLTHLRPMMCVATTLHCLPTGHSAWAQPTQQRSRTTIPAQFMRQGLISNPLNGHSRWQALRADLLTHSFKYDQDF